LGRLRGSVRREPAHIFSWQPASTNPILGCITMMKLSPDAAPSRRKKKSPLHNHATKLRRIDDLSPEIIEQFLDEYLVAAGVGNLEKPLPLPLGRRQNRYVDGSADASHRRLSK
jgi:hypothetical protein